MAFVVDTSVRANFRTEDGLRYPIASRIVQVIRNSR